MLADDDRDDCNFFKEALEELPVTANLITVNDGEELMQRLLEKTDNLPDVLFLDLNMPRKSGSECLKEIMQDEKLNKLPVIIFSTSLDTEVVNLLYDKGAQYYIRKPTVFSQMKGMIFNALTLVKQVEAEKPTREGFIL